MIMKKKKQAEKEDEEDPHACGMLARIKRRVLARVSELGRNVKVTRTYS